jgi:hypothetical protein
MTRYVFIVVVLITLCGYLLTRPAHPIGYADTEELLTTAHLLSVAHPSGYPFVSLSLGLIHRLLPAVPLALVANTFSSLIMAISMGLVGSILYLMQKHYLKNLADEVKVIIAITLSVSIGFTALVWLYAVTFEIIAYTVFFAVSLILSVIRWQTTLGQKSNLRWFYISFFVAAVNLAHVQTSVLMFPALATILLTNRSKLTSINRYRYKRTWIKAIGVFAVPLIIYVSLLFVLNANKAPVSWYFPQNLSGIINFITRKDYTGRYVDEDIIRPAYLTPINQTYITVQPEYISFLISHLTLPLFMLSLIGLAYMVLHQRRPVTYFLLVLWFFTGPVLAGRLGLPSLDSGSLIQTIHIGILHRQYPVGEISYAIFALFGFYWLYTIFSLHKKSITLISIVLLALAANVVASNVSIGYQKDNLVIELYAKNMLDTVDENAVIICSADIACFSLLYHNIVLGYRSDVTVLTQNNLYRKHFLDHNPQLYNLPYNENPYFFAALTTSLLPERSVYLTNPSDYYIEYIGLDGNPFFLIPQGYLFQVATNPQAVPFSENTYEPTQVLLTRRDSPKDFFASGLKGYFASLHSFLGLLYSKYNLKSPASTNFEYAISLMPDNATLTNRLLSLPEYHGDEQYLNGTASNSARLRQIARDYYLSGDIQNAYDSARKASYLEPTNVDTRFFLVDVLLLGDYEREAKNELLSILVYDPSNASAAARLQNLQ